GLDMPLTLWVAAGFFCVSESFRSDRPVWLWLTGLFAGLAAATKYSGLVFAVVMCAALAARAVHTGNLSAWWNTGPARGRTRALIHAAGNALLIMAVAAIVVRVVMGAAGWEPYVLGVRSQLLHQDQGHPAFFLGDISQTGWIAYFPVAL